MNSKPKRPKTVTWLLVLVLIFTGQHWLRFATALSQWQFLQNLELRISPLYLAGSAFIWAAVGLVLAWGLWSGKSWAPPATRATALTFAAYYWLDRTLAQSTPAGGGNWPFALAGTALLLGYTFWILGRPAAKAFFGDSDD